MFWLRYLLFVSVLLWLQLKLPFHLFGIPCALELLFLASLNFALVQGSRRGAMASLIAGGMTDTLSLAPFGQNMICFALSGALAGTARRFLYTDPLGTRLMLVLLFTSLLQLFRSVCFWWEGTFFPVSAVFWQMLLPMLSWHAAAFPLLFWAMKGLRLTRPLNEDQETVSAATFRRFRRRLGKKLEPASRGVESWK